MTRMTRPLTRMAVLALVPLLTACGDLDDGALDDAALERLASAEEPIINGALDTTHQAVVALFSQQAGCTCTIIHVSGSSAYVLTAAHCFGNGPIQVVAIGNDYQFATEVLNVVDYQVHPQYDTNQLIYDFAMIRATGASSSTPVIPALRPDQDNLGVGSPVLHVGYGLTSVPNGSTSQRHSAPGSLAEGAQIQIGYNQPNQGPCSGDSGGPNLYDGGQGERVAGVVSYGDQNCNQFGVSGRVSAVYNSFIVPFIGQDPTSGSGPATSTSTSTSATSTSATSGVGGSTGIGGGDPVGVGAGAGAPDDAWIAPGTEEKDYDGDIQVAGGCSVSSQSEPKLGWLAIGSLLGLGLVAARRRRG